ncbi:dehydrogenase/reductase SDR family member 4 [Galendromus occidentalis]|uniref:Dehydrogenase/reductase SDR family member 4 n=1 Tax=Galendromus occidentalis TaxID=34638 RepID=A0AAJ6QRP6_9ACAR|nr:dehydrogenase/reductase SDR family member 4 [Galendromus occidentalis]
MFSHGRRLTLQAARHMGSAAKLQGKVAVVTASTDGIGFAIARRLAQDGAKVVISSRKEDNVNKAVETLTKEGLTVTGVPCHVGDADQRKNLLKTAVDKFGGLDILVSNAAVNPSATQVLDTPEKAWDKIFEINVKSAFMLTQEAVPLLEKRGQGNIVYISSIAAYQAMPLLGAYSVSKTALLGLTRAAALQLAASKIRVNCVAPGIIKTKFSQLLWEDDGVNDAILQTTPLGRLGAPEDIAGAVSFLVSDDAAYVTGETLPVAGGYFCKL